MTEYPSFYDPERIGALFTPDMAEIEQAAIQAGLPPVSPDEPQVHLLLVDMQVDFCHEQGSLYVPGALGDVRRVIEFIFRNAAVISQITCSLDSHLPNQIFSPVWWADAEGRHPAPFTIITAADVEAGRWRPLSEPEWSRYYVRELEAEAKKQLTIWPYHTLIGSNGHTLDGELWSAVAWHSLARRVAPHWMIKGSEPRTEHYSIIQPEIHVPGRRRAARTRLFWILWPRRPGGDRGRGVESLRAGDGRGLGERVQRSAGHAEKFLVLQDCTSPVAHLEIDFGALAEQRCRVCATRLRLANSTDPLPRNGPQAHKSPHRQSPSGVLSYSPGGWQSSGLRR